MTATLYLGTHKAVWLSRMTEPLFVSRRTLAERRTMPRSVGRWALDSGGFTELKDSGEWTFSEQEYVRDVRRFRDEIGNLEWAAPMDWMCEPSIIATTGRTVDEHQIRTIHNLLFLRYLAPDLPFIPVVQGWTLEDYVRCVELYAACGLDLELEPLVGVGSICRRGSNDEIVRIMAELAGMGLRLHAFGVRGQAFRRIADLIVSADSMAWSFAARKEKQRTPGCPHARCSNCPKYAVAWWNRQLAAVPPTLWALV